jgi:hypothetical protein
MPADQTTSKGKGFTKSTSQISFEIIHESGEYCNIESARPSSSSSLKKFGTEEQEFLTLLDIVAKRLVHGKKPIIFYHCLLILTIIW